MMQLMKILDSVLKSLGISEEELSRALAVRGAQSGGVTAASTAAAAVRGSVPHPVRITAPSSLVYLLLDVSGSMAEGNKLSQAKLGARNFAEKAIAMGYTVGVIRFSEEAEVAVEPSADISRIWSAIWNRDADGSTDMAAAIQLAAARLSGRTCERAIVLVTDGFPDDGEAARQAAEDAKRSGITIIAIGTDDADRAFLAELASATELARKVSREELQVAITDASRLLPAKGSR